MTWRIYALTTGQPNWDDHALQFLHALFVGGDLRLDVGDVHVGASGGVFCARQKFAELGLAEVAAIDQQEVVDDYAFFLQSAGHRRGGAGGGAADVGVMAAAADEEQDVLAVGIEYRRDDGDVRQVGAAVERVVQRDDVAGLQRKAPVIEDGADALAHRAEVDRDVRRVGHQIAVGVEDGAGEVQTFLDVHAHRGVLQHRAGLFGDVHEQVVEQFQQHRIGPFAAGWDARWKRLGAAQDHVVERRDLGGPAGFDDGGGVGLADQGRTGDTVAREQGGAFEDRSFHVRAVGEHGDAVDRFGGAGFTRGQRGLLGDGAGQRGLGGNGFNHDRPFRRGEAEPRSVSRGEV